MTAETKQTMLAWAMPLIVFVLSAFGSLALFAMNSENRLLEVRIETLDKKLAAERALVKALVDSANNAIAVRLNSMDTRIMNLEAAEEAFNRILRNQYMEQRSDKVR